MADVRVETKVDLMDNDLVVLSVVKKAAWLDLTSDQDLVVRTVERKVVEMDS